MSDAVYIALIGAASGILASILTYLATRERMRGEAASTANNRVDEWYAAVIEDNERLKAENRQHEDRLQSLEAAEDERSRELRELQRRIGTYEADLARLKRENESLRQEIDRMADEVQRERTEKQLISRNLIEAERAKVRLESRVNELEREMKQLKARMPDG